MSGERYYAREAERRRTAGLRERREFEREQRLDLQDEQLADTSHHAFAYTCACGAPSPHGHPCNDCYRELGGES